MDVCTIVSFKYVHYHYYFIITGQRKRNVEEKQLFGEGPNFADWSSVIWRRFGAVYFRLSVNHFSTTPAGTSLNWLIRDYPVDFSPLCPNPGNNSLTSGTPYLFNSRFGPVSQSENFDNTNLAYSSLKTEQSPQKKRETAITLASFNKKGTRPSTPAKA
jgi:hypothetical protein